jgi:hypothetical protein
MSFLAQGSWFFYVAISLPPFAIQTEIGPHLLQAALDGGVGRHGGYATLVAAVSSHLDVALVTPLCSPGVLHEEVSISVADGKHTMIKTHGATVRLIVNS